MERWSRADGAAAVRLFLSVCVVALCSVASADQWLTHGGTLLNQRWARSETKLNVTTAPTLTQVWAFTTLGDVSATPAIYKGVLYTPDWAGMVWAINQTTGVKIWGKNVSLDYGIPNSAFHKPAVSRTTPAIFNATQPINDLLIFGVNNPAYVFAVKRMDGKLVWKTQVDTHIGAQVTGSGTVYGGAVYFGVASAEESLAANPTYPCCNFIGSVVKLDVLTGKLLWKTLMLPNNKNRTDRYAGAGVWAATPSIDVARGLVFVGVGNNYRVPLIVSQCELGQTINPITPDPCIEEGNYFDAIVALSLGTGAVVWATNLNPFDAWNVACLFANNPNCPRDPGPDYDFGMAPFLATIKPNGVTALDVVIAGQKSGIVWALNRATGKIVWSQAAGPGGLLGGMAWGLATDGRRVYVGMENSDGKPWTLLPGADVVTTGGWVAMDIHTGAVLWSVPNPGPYTAYGMVPTVANGVVLVGSPDPDGHAFALEAATGRVLWAFTTGASVYGGMSVDNGCVYFGKGYVSLHSFANTTGGGPQKIYAFCVVPGKKVPPSPPPSPVARASPPPPLAVTSPPPPSSLPSPAPSPVPSPPSPPPVASPPPCVPTTTPYTPKVVDVGGYQGWIFNVYLTWTPPRVFVGDRLRFTWDEEAADASGTDHNVWCLKSQAAFDACDFSRYECELGENGYTTPAFTAPGTYWYACEVGGHCAANQKVKIVVEAAPTTSGGCPPAASLPPPQPSPPPTTAAKPPPPSSASKPPPPASTSSPPPAAAGGATILVGNRTNGWDYSVAFTWNNIPLITKGDKLRFQWTSSHDVWQMPNKNDYDNCDFSRSDKLTEVLGSGDYLYNVTANPGTVLYFGCAVGFHCAAAMKVAIPVS